MTEPPFSLKKLSISVQPPKKDMRKGVFVIIITIIRGISENRKLIPLENVLLIGYMILGTYTFVIREEFSVIEVSDIEVTSLKKL